MLNTDVHSTAPLALTALSAPAELSWQAWTRATGLSLSAARSIVGGLSSPGKMPSHSYSTPAAECGVGGALWAADQERKARGEAILSVCGGCYARKGRYVFPNVQAAQYRRFSIVLDALASSEKRELWVRAMVVLIGWYERFSRCFRWHDAGDLISLGHLSMICEVCELLPWVSFWIPTREFKIVAAYLAEHGSLPANLNVRQSSAMLGHLPNPERAGAGRTFSGVALKGQEVPEGLWQCPARFQSGKCSSCRACWDVSVPVVIYPLH